MLKRTTGAAALALALAGLPALAQERIAALRTAADLAALCGPPEGDPMFVAAANLCDGFMMGAHAVHEQLKAADLRPMYCVTDANRPTLDEASAAFAAWAATAPDMDRVAPIDGLFRWAASAYPCPR